MLSPSTRGWSRSSAAVVTGQPSAGASDCRKDSPVNVMNDWKWNLARAYGDPRDIPVRTAESSRQVHPPVVNLPLHDTTSASPSSCRPNPSGRCTGQQTAVSQKRTRKARHRPQADSLPLHSRPSQKGNPKPHFPIRPSARPSHAPRPAICQTIRPMTCLSASVLTSASAPPSSTSKTSSVPHILSVPPPLHHKTRIQTASLINHLLSKNTQRTTETDPTKLTANSEPSPKTLLAKVPSPLAPPYAMPTYTMPGTRGSSPDLRHVPS